MIIKGKPAGSVSYWSKHLLRDDTNEKAEVKEITGLSATDLAGALKEMKAVAAGSRCQGNFMYQANINPLAHEHLTPEQWKEAVDTLEKNLGLEGHQRVVVEHVKEDRQHVHIIWNRVDVNTMRVADMGGNWPIHVETARELERKFGLTPTHTKSPEERERAAELWEKRAQERSGIDIKDMKKELTELWRSSDSGIAFKAAIEERGYILAKGDRRDFCVVDRAGDAHSLARRLDGVKAEGVRAKLSDIDRESLPTVEAARQEQRAISRDMAAMKAATEDHSPEPYSPSPMAGMSNAALGVANVATGGVEKLADFLADFLTGGIVSARPQHMDGVDKLIADRRAEAALYRIRDSIESGDTLRPEDIQALSRDVLNNMLSKGDSYLLEIVRRMDEDRDRERENERGRTRDH